MNHTTSEHRPSSPTPPNSKELSSSTTNPPHSNQPLASSSTTPDFEFVDEIDVPCSFIPRKSEGQRRKPLTKANENDDDASMQHLLNLELDDAGNIPHKVQAQVQIDQSHIQSFAPSILVPINPPQDDILVENGSAEKVTAEEHKRDSVDAPKHSELTNGTTTILRNREGSLQDAE